MAIWTIKVESKEYKIKSLKAEMELLDSALYNLVNTSQFMKQLTGVKGKKETTRSSIVMTLFSKNKLENPDLFEKEKNEFLENLSELIEKKDIPDLIKKAKEIHVKHIPVVDERKTEEYIDERNNKYKEELKKREEQTQEFISKYCKPEPTKIPDEMIAVSLQITFDDSDSQTDYFNRHCSIGKEMLLAIVAKQRRTERLARSVLNNYPELLKLKWTWHVENWSMGHGTYLMSEWTENQFKKNAYDGRTEVSTRYELSFNEYTKEMYPYKEYVEYGTDNSVEVADEIIEGVTVSRNEAKNGIEIKFPDKPSDEIRSILKSNGFRWSRRQKIWYTRFSAYKLTFAESFKKSA